MNTRRGFTLIELIVVCVVIAGLATLLIPAISQVTSDGRETSTKASLIQIRDAVMQYWRDTKHVTLDGTTTVATEADRFQIQWLFNNPVDNTTDRDFNANTRIGWNGPYIAHSTGDPVSNGGPILVDAWNQEIVIQDVDSTSDARDIRIVSIGSNGTLDIPANTATSALTALDVGDDLYVALTLR